VITSPPKTRTPTQQRAVHTRHALVEAAEREFARRGYEATTAKSIAVRAKVATGSFYQYFTCKDEVLREIAEARHVEAADHALAALEAAPAPSGARNRFLHDVRLRMTLMVEVTLAFYAAHGALEAVIAERRFVDRELHATLRACERRVIERVAQLLQRWGHRGDVEATAYVLFNAVRGALHAHALDGASLSKDRFTASLVDAVIRIALPGSPIPSS